jgi:8-oxo-dGTP diphosphatase
MTVWLMDGPVHDWARRNRSPLPLRPAIRWSIDGRDPLTPVSGRRDNRHVAATDPDHQHRVVAGLAIRQGSVLLCHRTIRRQWCPGVWDLPGGHIEVGETAAAALIRELREELGIIAHEPLRNRLAHLVIGDFDMQVWPIDRWSGSPTNMAHDEHDELAWFTAAEALELRLAHDSYPSLITKAIGAVSSPNR